MTGPTIVARRLITNKRFIFVSLGSAEGDVFGRVISVHLCIHITKRSKQLLSCQGRAPLRVQILSFSCSFWQKNLQNNRLAHPFWELAHPSGKSWICHCLRKCPNLWNSYTLLWEWRPCHWNLPLNLAVQNYWFQEHMPLSYSFCCALPFCTYTNNI